MEHLSLNGKIVPDAAIPATDPAVLYGFGVFEVTRAYGGAPFRIRDHMDRMKRSARHFGLRLKYATRWVDAHIRELCRKNGLDGAYVRVTLTGGGNFLIRTRPLEAAPSAWWKSGARILLSESRRDPAGILYGHKTLNYLENVLLRDRARKLGAADTILLGLRNEVLEGCVSNVFLVKRGRLVTPTLEDHILPGVTRKVVLELAAKLGIRVDERTVYAGEFHTAEETFLTNSLLEVVPVTQLGTKRLGSVGPVTRKLAEAYREQVRRELGRPA